MPRFGGAPRCQAPADGLCGRRASASRKWLTYQAILAKERELRPGCSSNKPIGDKCGRALCARAHSLRQRWRDEASGRFLNQKKSASAKPSQGVRKERGEIIPSARTAITIFQTCPGS